MKTFKEISPSSKTIAIIIIIVLFLSFPLYIREFYIFLISLALTMALFGLSFNLLLGYMGKLSFGHAAFFGLGAFFLTIGMTAGNLSYPLAALTAIAITAAVAAVIGIIAVRLKDIYFALFTLAIAAVFEYLTSSLRFFGGADGLSVPHIASLINYYYFTLAISFACTYIIYRIVRSPFGEVIKAIKDNTERAKHIGINVTKFQWINWMIACIFAGVAGVLVAPLLGHVGPSLIGVGKSTEAVVLTILGGMNIYIGPIGGALFLVFIKEWLSTISLHWMSFLGIAVLAVVLFLPHGILGTGETLIRRKIKTGASDKRRVHDPSASSN